MTGDLSDLVIENKGQLKAVRNILTSKSGRPRKPDSEKMSKKITVNFTQREYEALQAGEIGDNAACCFHQDCAEA